jgi:hypothetical protein
VNDGVRAKEHRHFGEVILESICCLQEAFAFFCPAVRMSRACLPTAGCFIFSFVAIALALAAR